MNRDQLLITINESIQALTHARDQLLDEGVAPVVVHKDEEFSEFLNPQGASTEETEEEYLNRMFGVK